MFPLQNFLCCFRHEHSNERDIDIKMDTFGEIDCEPASQKSQSLFIYHVFENWSIFEISVLVPILLTIINSHEPPYPQNFLNGFIGKKSPELILERIIAYKLVAATTLLIGSKRVSTSK